MARYALFFIGVRAPFIAPELLVMLAGTKNGPLGLNLAGYGFRTRRKLDLYVSSSCL